MQKGLREDRKITEYERKKRIVTSVIEIVGLLFLATFGYFIYLQAGYVKTVRGLSSNMLTLFLILAGIEFVLYLANVLICSVLDHVIEMCYANQYRALRDSAQSQSVMPKAEQQ